jgi:hypothetical protein
MVSGGDVYRHAEIVGCLALASTDVALGAEPELPTVDQPGNKCLGHVPTRVATRRGDGRHLVEHGAGIQYLEHGRDGLP